MDYRRPLHNANRGVPQRTVSGGFVELSNPLPKRPNFPSRLGVVRSISQPVPPAGAGKGERDGAHFNDAAFFSNAGASVNSPREFNEEGYDDGRPAKRFKTSAQDIRTERQEDVAYTQDKAFDIMPGSPLPSLPFTRLSSDTILAEHSARNGIASARRKAHGAEPPAVAVRVPAPKKVVDFSPWTGDHPEDILNETVIKNGYVDKPATITQTENNTAKASIWSSLSQKNHPGLGLLGHLYTAVMEKRLALSKCTAPSTFKPPPRVTVTDTKREAWLRDLANPEIPLRRQSRTIPHGIRGRLLMEQCLSKNIPLQRAIWLAKCVGANELRAFRRKGVSGVAAASGEVKWVNEWTVHVEQFLAGIVATCGQDNWRQSMSYAIKLVAAFYSEKLLESGHFLDWVVTALTESTVDKLAVWIAITQVFWKEIFSRGRRGRKLVEGILVHLHRLTTIDGDMSSGLKMRLRKLVAVVASSNRACIVLPRTWCKYAYLLQPQNAIATTSSVTTNINRRFERIAGLANKTAANTRSPLVRLYDDLDDVGLDLDIIKLTMKCLRHVPDAAELVHALLDWASTPYRKGAARIYITSRTIAHLHALGHDTDASLLRYVHGKKDSSTSGIANIHGVIASLLRFKAFSAGRYFSWLISSGTLSAEAGNCAASLVAALPLGEITEELQGIRKTILRRLNYAGNEEGNIQLAVARIEDDMARSETERVPVLELLRPLSVSEKLSVSDRICTSIGAKVKAMDCTLKAFLIARDVIEATEDVITLAAMLAAAISTEDPALLAAVIDTVNMHAESLAALGSLTGLSSGLMEQHILLRSQQPLDRTSILALIRLARQLSSKTDMTQLLAEDLSLCEQQSNLAVCSPASDNLVSMHASSLDSDEDIDTVFASGNTMDEQLMQRVFLKIVQRACKPSSAPPTSVSKACEWFNQLRAIDGDEGTFRAMATRYVHDVIKGTQYETHGTSAIRSLVASDCLALETVVREAEKLCSPESAGPMLALFTFSEGTLDGLSACERYRYCLKQKICQVEHRNSILKLIGRHCESRTSRTTNPALLDFVIKSASAKPTPLYHELTGSSLSSSGMENVHRMLSAILQNSSASDGKLSELDLPSVVAIAGPLSIRLCVDFIRFQAESASLQPESQNSLALAVIETFSNDSRVWPQLLEFASEAVHKTVRDWAQDQLFSLAAGEGAFASKQEDFQTRCLELLAITSKCGDKRDDTVIVTTIARKLKGLHHHLLATTSFDSESRDLFASRVKKLRVLLDMCVLHIHQDIDDNESYTQARCSLFASLIALLLNPKLSTDQDLMEYLFDLCSALSDNLSDVPNLASKCFGSTPIPPDPRLTSLFGPDSSSTTPWLALALPPQPPPTSQQNRALNRHPSHQQQQQQQQQHQRLPSQPASGTLRNKEGAIAPSSEAKLVPFTLRQWELIPDPTPLMGENDTSLSLGLFGARRI